MNETIKQEDIVDCVRLPQEPKASVAVRCPGYCVQESVSKLREKELQKRVFTIEQFPSRHLFNSEGRRFVSFFLVAIQTGHPLIFVSIGVSSERETKQ